MKKYYCIYGSSTIQLVIQTNWKEHKMKRYQLILVIGLFVLGFIV